MGNSSLYSVLNVLRKAYSDNPQLIGFGAFGLDEIYQKLKAFISKVGKNNKFYVAAIDIEKCYDNINTRLLYQIIRLTPLIQA